MTSSRTQNPCRCGCYLTTAGTYAPGHDAKHVARLYRHVTECETRGAHPEIELARVLPTLPSERLQVKLVSRLVESGRKYFARQAHEIEHQMGQGDDWFKHAVARHVRAAGWDPARMSPLTQAYLVAALSWTYAKICRAAS